MATEDTQEAGIVLKHTEGCQSEIIGSTFVVPNPMVPLMESLTQTQRERRNVVLFGAGVSRYAGYICPKPPALGSELLGTLRTFDQTTWGSLPECFASHFDQGFEVGMESISSGEIDWFPRLMRSTSKYFLCFAPDGSGMDAYSRFVRALSRRKTATTTLLSTLNYECLLEYGANIEGLHFAHFNAEPIERNASIWKLHGSCSFAPGAGVQFGRGVNYDGSTIIESGITFLTPTRASEWLRGDTALYSAMCMFAPNKPVQFAPSLFQAVHTSWGGRVTTASAVLVAGARPHPADKHIWSPLSTTPATVGFIGSKAEYESWLPQRGGKPTSYLGSKFEEIVDDAAEFVSQY